MLKYINKKTIAMSAAFTTGMLSAAPEALAGTKTFSDISNNISTSMSAMPGLVSGISYLLGVVLGVLGIMKVKDHVENPQQTPLKDGAIRLAAGGGLFALPIIYEAMFSTIGNGNQQQVQQLYKVNTANLLTK